MLHSSETIWSASLTLNLIETIFIVVWCASMCMQYAPCVCWCSVCACSILFESPFLFVHFTKFVKNTTKIEFSFIKFRSIVTPAATNSLGLKLIPSQIRSVLVRFSLQKTFHINESRWNDIFDVSELLFCASIFWFLNALNALSLIFRFDDTNKKTLTKNRKWHLICVSSVGVRRTAAIKRLINLNTFLVKCKLNEWI